MCEKYPTRPAHFAHKFTRLLFRVCAAQEIGPNALALLICIAHTEDAKRYKSPVTYWNHQLESVLGISWGALQRARTKAMEAGFLHYERGANRMVGRYWVTIPSDFADIDDGVFDASLDVSFTDSVKETVKETDDKRMINGEETDDKRTINADPSTLIPNPNPNPKETTSPSARKDKFDPATVPIPEHLTGPCFQEAWHDWIRFRREKRAPITPTMAAAQMKQFARWGPERSIAAINHTIVMGWQGLREPEPGASNGAPKKPKISFIPEDE